MATLRKEEIIEVCKRNKLLNGIIAVLAEDCGIKAVRVARTDDGAYLVHYGMNAQDLDFEKHPAIRVEGFDKVTIPKGTDSNVMETLLMGGLK